VEAAVDPHTSIGPALITINMADVRAKCSCKGTACYRHEPLLMLIDVGCLYPRYSQILNGLRAVIKTTMGMTTLFP
jgi:hypothetical protein